MLNNLFSNVNTKNKLFTLNSAKIFKDLAKEHNSEELLAKEIDESLSLPFEINKGKKALIKAFSFQPNLNGYEIILRERKEELEKGLEKIKSLNEIKFISCKKDKAIFEDLKAYGEVVKVSPIIDLYDNKLKSKAYGESNDVVIYDIIDIVNLGQALLKKEIESFITVYGSAVNGNKVCAVSKNTTYRQVFEALNGKENILSKVIDGGSLNGTPVYDLNSPIKSNSRGILFLTENDLPTNKSCSCINCSKCLRACPEGLNPIKLMDLYKRKEKEEFIRFGGNKCIDCGLCSFVCPSNLEIAQTIKTAKEFN